MHSSEASSLKIDLEQDAKRCGNCGFCETYQVLIYQKDMIRLKRAAEQILAATTGGPVLKSEHVLNLLCIAERFNRKKVYCHKEKAWTHLLDTACSLWRPREVEKQVTTSTPGQSS